MFLALASWWEHPGRSKEYAFFIGQTCSSVKQSRSVCQSGGRLQYDKAKAKMAMIRRENSMRLPSRLRLLLALLTLGPASINADEGATRTFPAQKCRFTLPESEWTWSDKEMPNLLFMASNKKGFVVNLATLKAAALPCEPTTSSSSKDSRIIIFDQVRSSNDHRDSLRFVVCQLVRRKAAPPMAAPQLCWLFAAHD